MDMVRRLAVFFVVSCAFAYIVFLFAGSVITSQAIEQTRIVRVRDVLQPNVHHLSGMIMAPSTCAEVSLETASREEDTFELMFRTWEEPSVECILEDTPRSFHAIVFAPAVGIHFYATLDGEPVTIVVEPVIQH